LVGRRRLKDRARHLLGFIIIVIIIFYFIFFIIIVIIINDSIYPAVAVSKALRTGNKVSCQPNDCPNR